MKSYFLFVVTQLLLTLYGSTIITAQDETTPAQELTTAQEPTTAQVPATTDDLSKKLDVVLSQLKTNADLLQKLENQQQDIVNQLEDQDSSYLLNHIRGNLMMDTFNNHGTWTTLKTGLKNLLYHTSLYSVVQKLPNQDAMPMDQIVYSNYDYLLRTLLDYGLYVDTESASGDTFLHLAAKYNEQSIAVLVINRGADITVKDQDGNTPLIIAASNNSMAVLRLLKNDTADLNAVNDVGRTGMHYAAENGYLDAVRYLVEAGADMKIADNYKMTPLDLAIKAKREDVVKYLSQFSLFSLRKQKNSNF